MMAKALYGAQNGLDAALCGGTGTGLELPTPDRNQVVSCLVYEAYASWHWK
jgi:hypothetical protein